MEKQSRLGVLVFALSRVIDESKRLHRTLVGVYGQEKTGAIIARLGLPVRPRGLEEWVIGSLDEGVVIVVYSLTETAEYEALRFTDGSHGVCVEQVFGDATGWIKTSMVLNFVGTREGDLMEAYRQIVGG